MKIPYLIAACIIGFFSLSCGLSAKEIMNSIAGYTFGDTVPGKQTKIQFRLKKPFLEFEQGIVHVNPKTRKIEAIELRTSLGIAVAKIPTKRNFNSFDKSWEKERKERKVREDLAINRTFTLALAALDDRYHLGGASRYDVEVSTKTKARISQDGSTFYLENESDEYRLVTTKDGYSRVVKRSAFDVESTRKIPPLQISASMKNFTTHSYEIWKGVVEREKCPYGIDTWHGDPIYAYDGPISDTENSLEIRRLYFCVDKNNLRLVIKNHPSEEEISSSNNANKRVPKEENRVADVL